MKRTTKQTVIHGLGGTLYVVWVLEWLWLVMLYVERLFETKIAEVVFPVNPGPIETAPSGPAPSLPLDGPMSPVFIGLALLVAAAIIVAAVYVIARVYVPDVHRVAQQTVQKTAEVSVERAVKHHVVPAKERRKLTIRVAFWLKVAICLIPVAIVFTVPGTTSFMPREAAQAGTLFFAVVAFVLTVIQYLLMRRWRIHETSAP